MFLDGSLYVDAHVSSIPIQFVRAATCGSSDRSSRRLGEKHPVAAADEVIEPSPDDQPAAVIPAAVITVSTDADSEWYSMYGESSNDVIAGIVNAAEAIYTAQLGIGFKLVKQHTYATNSPYNSTNATATLTTFTNNPENPTNLSLSPATYDQDVTLRHLFTGKDLDGAVVGIAYIGVACFNPALSYGVTQHYVDAAMPAIFAHEVAHNLGAEHDFTDSTSLMYPSVTVPPADHFSATSLAQIQSHLSLFNTCLIPNTEIPGGGALPTPLPTAIPGDTPVPPVVDGIDPNDARLTISRRRVGGPTARVVLVSGRLTDLLSEPYVNRSISLVANDMTVTQVVTDGQGEYAFFIRVAIPEGETIDISATAAGGLVRSSPVALRRTRTRTARR